MAITISGENNNDRILAQDGVIDSISGFNIAGIITASSFTGDLTGDVTGNLTGNVNATSNLLLQIGGSEKFRVASSGQLGIGGANYGTSGQVLTSGGSGSPPSWSTINSDKITEGNTEAEVYDNGSDGRFTVTTEGAERLRITSSGNIGAGTNNPDGFYTHAKNLVIGSGSSGEGITIFSGSSDSGYIGFNDTVSNGMQGFIQYNHNGDYMAFGPNGTEKVRIDSSGRLLIGTTTEGHSNAENLTVSDSGAAGITIRSTGNNCHIYFSDATSGAGEYVGQIAYNHSSDYMNFITNGSERLRIDSSGRLLLGTTTEGHPNADEFTISFNNTGVSGGDQGRCGMSIRSGNNTSGVTQPGYIYFSDGTSGDNESKGVVAYDHNADELYLSSDGVKAFGLNSSGHFHLGRDYSSNPQNGLVGITTIRGHRVNEAGDYAHLYFKNSSVSGNSSASIRAFRDGSNYSTGLSFYTYSSNSSGGDGSERFKIDKEGTITHSAVTALQIAKGTTAQRPSNPVDGMIRFNTTLSQTEEYRNSGWFGLSNLTTVTGGTTTTSGGYTIHTFTSSGTLTVTGGSKTGVDYLLVAGGGGGGDTRAGGGGGGGMTVTTGATIPAGTYTITVGAGGAGGTSSSDGTDGGATSFGSIASVVGGGGGGGQQRVGRSGGSGGGGSDSRPGGAGTSGQGNNGGGSSGSSGGGGGGGKGSVGNNGDTDSGNNFVDNNSGGNGGNGANNSYSGSNVSYAGGGGGGSRDNGPYGAGVHGGGNGGQNSSNVAQNGTANLGGGGGGGARLHGAPGSTYNGAAGGSGIVIIRYAT